MVSRLGRRWVMLGLLFAGTALNYLDRIILPVLLPVIRKEIPVSEAEYGYLTAAFQAAYGVGNLVLGGVIDVVGTRVGYAAALAVWSLAAAGHAASRGLLDMGVWRAALGLGEAGNFPAAAKAIAEWFPPRERSLAMGVCVASTNVAAMAGPGLFVYLSGAYGWRTAFLAVGGAGVMLAVVWAWFYRAPAVAAVGAGTVRWRDALRERETWGFAFGKFFTDPVWWFYIFWLPLYLFDVRKLELREVAWALPVIYLMADVGSVAGGWLPGYLIRRGWKAGRARKAAMGVCVALMPVAALAVLAPGIGWTVALISLGTMGHQGWSANLFTSVSDVYPAGAVGSVVGIGQAWASVGGLLFSSLLPGFLITHFGYTPVFLVLGTFHVIGFCCVHWLMGDLEPRGR